MVLMKYGFGDLVQRLDLPVKSLVHKITPEIDTDIDIYKRIRFAIEELGPTFIKMGQILSMRPDLLPHPMIRELSRLQDDVSPLPFDAIKTVLEKEFGTTLNHLFHTVESAPEASASLSQVHRAVRLDQKTIVAVKVRRPGIEKTLKTDLDILDVVARQSHENIDSLRVYDLPGIVAANRRSLLREIDFLREARHIQIARSNLKNDTSVVIPEVFTRESTTRVLVTEFINGIKITADMVLPDSDRKALAGKGVRTAVRQILEHGFYHADPHPGNMFIAKDNRLCLIDWGMVGRLTPEERNDLLFLIQSLVDHDSAKLSNVLLNIATARISVDRHQLERDLMDLMDIYLSLPLKEIRINEMLDDFVEVLRVHGLRLPPDMSIVIKALITVEGTARILYPKLDVISEARPHVRKLVSRQYSFEQLRKRLRDNISSFWSLQRHLPSTLSAILKKVKHGELTIRFEHKNLTALRKELEDSFNRLTLGIILGAMIIGSSMIITTGVPPMLFGFPALGLIGYLISAVLGLWLIITIIRRQNF